MELDDNKIKEIERLKLLFHLPEFWEKERAITTMEALRAIESEDRDADSVLLVDSYLGANESLNKVTFKFDASQRLRDKWEKEENEVALLLSDGSFYTTGVTNFDKAAGEVTISWNRKKEDDDIALDESEEAVSQLADPRPFLSEVKALALWDWYRREHHSRSLVNVINSYLCDDAPSVAREIIERNKPRTRGITNYCPTDTGDLIEPVMKAIENLDRSYLPIQGPPGTGKTYIGSRIISKLLKGGLESENDMPRVAIVSQSWDGIDNLFRATIDQLCELGLESELKGRARKINIFRTKSLQLDKEKERFEGVDKLFRKGNGVPSSRGGVIQYGVNPDSDEEGEEWYFRKKVGENIPEPGGPIKGQDLHSSTHLLAASSWFFVRGGMREACREEIYGDDFKFDYIFIDEAGQFSLAEALAISHATKNIVLLGDPKQLPQVVKASHEGGADLSVMEYLIGKDKNVDSSKGFYLDTTWRMRPEVTTYISEQFYDHDLGLNEVCNKREILGVRNGLYFSEVKHEECSRSSKIEAEKVVEIVEDLLMMTFKDSSGDIAIERMVAESDFMVVAAFNEQVGMLTSELQGKGYPSVRVGTVDRFQGQEAPIVIYSLTSSNKDEIPAGRTEFLFFPNRTNVAVSRAQCLAVVVGSKDLLDTQPKTISEMEALNNLCRIFQDVEEAKGISSVWSIASLNPSST